MMITVTFHNEKPPKHSELLRLHWHARAPAVEHLEVQKWSNRIKKIMDPLARGQGQISFLARDYENARLVCLWIVCLCACVCGVSPRSSIHTPHFPQKSSVKSHIWSLCIVPLFIWANSDREEALIRSNSKSLQSLRNVWKSGEAISAVRQHNLDKSRVRGPL